MSPGGKIPSFATTVKDAMRFNRKPSSARSHSDNSGHDFGRMSAGMNLTVAVAVRGVVPRSPSFSSLRQGDSLTVRGGTRKATSIFSCASSTVQRPLQPLQSLNLALAHAPDVNS